ncbi:hypothetical protein IKF28_02375 [Candidatus Saccharibacteria bacterium]|nr:hypothetical protein [Candidatus Saccharibacteria bacterium]
MNEDNQKPEYIKNTKTTENTLRVIIVVLIICTVLSILGIGLGAYGAIQANNALGQLSEFIDTDDETIESEEYSDEPIYGKPSSVEEIEYIGINYNNGQDYIDIVKDEDGDYIEYYAYDSNNEYNGEVVETSVDDIFKYVFDNNLEHFGEENSFDNTSWEVEISSTNGSCYAKGESNLPDWLNALLEKLDVQNKGYKSKATE